MKKSRPQKIWIDADACPKAVKEIVFKAAVRLKLPIVLVANSSLFIPKIEFVNLIVVGKGDDVADQYIVDHVSHGELVITADIPLAARIVEKGALALNPRGEIYDEENIGEVLSMRNFMKELRDGGALTGGPSALNPKDLHEFANSLNKILS